MKMLKNLIHKLLPYQKYLLYRICVLSIALYSFLLWHYNKVLLSYPLNKLNKMQQRAALWILSIFCTSPTMEIEAIAGLIHIHIHLHYECLCSLITILLNHFLREDMLHFLSLIVSFWKIWLLSNSKKSRVPLLMLTIVLMEFFIFWLFQ